MTQNIFEIFNPGDRHWRENKDFDKVHVFTTKKGGRGPMQVDLDEGSIVLPTRGAANPEDSKPVRRGSRRAQKSAQEKASQPEQQGESPADEA